MNVELNTLNRPRNPVPQYVEDALDRSGLRDAYNERPAYQQNDYIGWITRAKRETTRQKRMTQMLEELRIGGLYMGMDHPPPRR